MAGKNGKRQLNRSGAYSYYGNAVRKDEEVYELPRREQAERTRPKINRNEKRRPKAVAPAAKKAQNFDYTVFVAVALLVVFGVVMIFSSSYYYTLTSARFNNDMYFFLRKQLIWAGLGICAMLFMANWNYKIWGRLSLAAYSFSCVCLVLVQFIGEVRNGQKRWLGVTESIGFQPSEVAKISLVLFLSYYIYTHKDCLKDFKGFMKCLAIIFLPAGLTAISNFSTALIIALIGAVILFVASPKIWYFIVGGVLAAGAGAVALVLFPYRISRVRIWLDPFSDPIDKGYQIIQGLYAVASGGLFGLGLGQSRQKTFIPEAYNDIIFAIICEELGMIGAFLVILLFAALIWRGIKIAIASDSMFGSLVAVGITAMIGIQSTINIAVVTNTIPNTGQPLPFISYGGTSLLFTMAAMGILLNISRYQR